MWWLTIFLAVILVLLLIPTISIPTKMGILFMILLFIIGCLIYVNLEKSKEKAPTECNTCNGPSRYPSRCSDCNYNPCKCSQVIPGQTECPRCRGGLGPMGGMPGIMGCGDCGRSYRCPGCLLK